MPAMLDHDPHLATALRRRICAEALLWLKTKYGYGDKTAAASDGADGIRRPPGANGRIDCSGFVVRVYAHIFPHAGLNPYVLDSAALRVSSFFRDVTAPEAGDLICWNGHVGIVTDPAQKKFIGSQSSTGVAVASYGTGYWAGRPNRLVRRWATLP